MARLSILSDLHREALPYRESFRTDPPAFDLRVAAGDVWDADPGRASAILRRLAGDKPIVFVMGNHEHWNGVVDETLILAHALADRAGITLLDGTIAGCRFLGTTLWSDYQLAGHLDPATPTGEMIEVAHDEGGGSHRLPQLGACEGIGENEHLGDDASGPGRGRSWALMRPPVPVLGHARSHPAPPLPRQHRPCQDVRACAGRLIPDCRVGTAQRHAGL